MIGIHRALQQCLFRRCLIVGFLGPGRGGPGLAYEGTGLDDTGYYSEANIELCYAAGIEPLTPAGREPHNLSMAERFADDPPPPENPTPAQTVAYRLRTRLGKELYAKRKSTIEPVFGIIKHVLGFRQFLLRGFQAVQSEWTLVCIAWNLKRLFALSS